MRVILFICLVFFTLISAETVYDVTKYGADPTGIRNSDDAINKTIVEASKQGGGMVHFPPGQYLTGPIELKSNITLHLMDRVVVKFSNDPKEYPKLNEKLSDGKTRSLAFTPLIRAFGQKNITIKGNAVLDGQGEEWWRRIPPPGSRPLFINFYQCQNITFENITLKSSPMYNLNIIQSDGILIAGINISNPANYVDPGPNTDGINCNSCTDLHITGVTISTGDDCIALDSGKNHPTKNVLIEKSRMFAGHGGVSIGSATSGGLSNVTVRDCVFNGTNRGLYIKSRRGRGGVIEDITYQNITMENIIKEGVAIALVYNGTDPGMHERNIQRENMTDTTPIVRNLHYDGISGHSKLNSIFIYGLPESPVENITMVNFSVQGGVDLYLNNTRNININGKLQKDKSRVELGSY